MEELKPCPFCGKKPKINGVNYVHCGNKMCVLYCRAFDQVNWNARQPQPAQKAPCQCCSACMGKGCSTCHPEYRQKAPALSVEDIIRVIRDTNHNKSNWATADELAHTIHAEMMKERK